MSVVLRFERNPHWVFLRDVGDEAVEDYRSQDLPRHGQERDAPVVAAVTLTAPVLEQGDDCGIPEFLWSHPFLPRCC